MDRMTHDYFVAVSRGAIDFLQDIICRNLYVDGRWGGDGSAYKLLQETEETDRIIRGTVFWGVTAFLK